MFQDVGWNRALMIVDQVPPEHWKHVAGSENLQLVHPGVYTLQS